MDSQSPTKTDSGTDADPPDLTNEYNNSLSYELKLHTEQVVETLSDAKLIEIPQLHSHEDATGDDLSDFVLGLDLSGPQTLEFKVDKESDTTETTSELQTYSSREYSEIQETKIGSRILVY